MSRGPNGMGGPASKGRGYSVGGPQQLVGPPPPPRRPITLHERVGEGSMRAGERKPEGPTPVKRRTLTPPRTLTLYDARPIGMDRPAADPPGAHDRREEASSVGAGREGRLPARTASPRWGGRHHQSRRMRFVWGRRWGGVCAQSVAPKGGGTPVEMRFKGLAPAFCGPPPPWGVGSISGPALQVSVSPLGRQNFLLRPKAGARLSGPLLASTPPSDSYSN